MAKRAKPFQRIKPKPIGQRLRESVENNGLLLLEKLFHTASKAISFGSDRCQVCGHLEGDHCMCGCRQHEDTKGVGFCAGTDEDFKPKPSCACKGFL
jgi:hypothetical protein